MHKQKNLLLNLIYSKADLLANLAITNFKVII